MSDNDKFDFGAALKELEAITAWFESEEADLDQALTKYERGMELASQLKQHLGKIQNRVEKIRARFDQAPQPEEVPPSSAAAEPELFSE